MSWIFVVVVLGVLVAFLIVPSKKSASGKKRTRSATGTTKSPVKVAKVPVSKVPLVTVESIASPGAKMSAAQAVKVVRAFYRGIGWFSHREDMTCEIENFQDAMQEYQFSLEGAIYDVEQAIQALEFEQEEFDPDSAESAALDAKIAALELSRNRAGAALSGFQTSPVEFVVAFLNHRIHGAKSPVEGRDWT